MSERLWAWIVWLACPLVIGLVAFYTLGAALVFLIPWWIGGPFWIEKDTGRWAPYWDPPRPRKLWWREFR